MFTTTVVMLPQLHCLSQGQSQTVKFVGQLGHFTVGTAALCSGNGFFW